MTKKLKRKVLSKYGRYYSLKRYRPQWAKQRIGGAKKGGTVKKFKRR